MIDVSDLIAAARDVVARAEMAPGIYRRYAGQPCENPKGDHYGCSDAANILYTINEFPRDLALRKAFVDALNDLQDEDGMWREDSHHPMHTTAHCLAALELFDAGPDRPVTALSDLADPDRMETFLDNIKWKEDPWRASHEGAGIYTAMVLSGLASREWRRRYVGWLHDNADPTTGFWRRGDVLPVRYEGVITGKKASDASNVAASSEGKEAVMTLFPHLAGSFHYLFSIQYERAPLVYPERMIDSCLKIYAEDPFPLGRGLGFSEIDWVYCLTRAGRQTAHRFDERMEAIQSLAVSYIDFLRGAVSRKEADFSDLHILFGVLCALTELQSALPGFIVTEKPLRLVLDRRPFI